MVTPLTWPTYLDTISRLAVVEPTNVDYLALAPQMVNYAELRLCRDLDFLSSVAAVPGFTLTQNVRSLVFPLETFVVLQDVNVITPAGIINIEAGERHQLYPTTREYLNAVHNSGAGAGLPTCYAMLNQNTILVGPWPDLSYGVELIGQTRPAALSATNPATFISTYLPDLFILASMIWISGYQRNFGRQSDDPQMAVSYEQQYQTLLKGAFVEEARKKYEAAAWTAMAPAPVATPSRQAQAG
jgi:hypothetical protein